MQRVASAVQTSGHTFAALLKACAKLKDFDRGLQLHAHVAGSGLLESNPFVGSTLIDMYAKCGALIKAQQVFNKLSVRDVVSWTAMIAGYAEHGHGKEALYCFEQMQLEGISPNAVTFVCGLKACGSIRDSKMGQQIHVEIERQGLLESSPVLGNSLVDMYAKCGLLAMAKQVFDKLRIKDIVSRTALITGYAEHGYGEEALEFLEQIELEGFSPDGVMLVCCLKACGTIGALDKGCELHMEIVRKGLVEIDIVVGNSLVDMYAKCGWLSRAQEVFDKLPVRTVVSWNVLIAGYGECENGGEALNCLELMQLEGVSPNTLTLMHGLKACASVGALDKIHEIHSEIEKKGFLERECPIGSTLVDVYAKCNALSSAQRVFDKLLVQDVFSWTALIAGYAEQGHGEQALMVFEKMQLDCVSPNAVTYVCTLKACSCIGAIDKGRSLHTEIVIHGLLEQGLVVGNALVDMYVKCSSLSIALHVFNMLPFRNVVSWATLLAGCIENGFGKEALDCVEQMLHEGFSHNVVTYACSLKACGMTGDVLKGFEVHAEVERQGLSESDVTIGNAVIDMYAKCGLLLKAQEAFDRLRVKDAFTWNALIAGYLEHGTGEEALEKYESMPKGVSPIAATYVHSLEACGDTGALNRGQELHTEVEIKGFLDRDLLLTSTLVVMYAKCGQLAMAHQIFDKLGIRDVISWTALIAGYTDHGLSMEALTCFAKMQLEGVSPNSITFSWCLKACASLGAIDKGQQIYAEIERQGLLLGDLTLGNTMMDLYIKKGALAHAQQVFERLPVRDTVSWTTLLTGYTECGYSEKAMVFFDQMLVAGVLPSAVTFVCVLKACSRLGAIDRGIEIHFEIERHGLLGRDLAVSNSLVDMYAKCGLLVNARHVFDLLPVQNAVSWATLIAGYAEHGHAEEALKCFEWMQFKGTSPSAATFVCALKSCCSLGATDKGYKIHSEIERRGLLESNLFVGNALIDVYAKFGWFAKAHELFCRLPVRDVVSWNALMAGYAQAGQSEEVFVYFHKMQGDRIRPDPVTFNVVLKACCRAGLASKSQTYFEAMSKDHGIIPTLEHHVYMIDVLGRAGQIDEALMMIKEMPCCPSFDVWHTLLCASRSWGSPRFGKQAFEKAVNVDGIDAIDYGSMSCGESCYEPVESRSHRQRCLPFATIYPGINQFEKENMVETMRGTGGDHLNQHRYLLLHETSITRLAHPRICSSHPLRETMPPVTVLGNPDVRINQTSKGSRHCFWTYSTPRTGLTHLDKDTRNLKHTSLEPKSNNLSFKLTKKIGVLSLQILSQDFFVNSKSGFAANLRKY